MTPTEILESLYEDMDKGGVKTIRDALERAEVVDQKGVTEVLKVLAAIILKGLMPGKDMATHTYSALFLAMKLGARLKEEGIL